jgi:hypothetical protein
MLAVGAASAVGAMASTTASTAVTHAISGLIFGSKFHDFYSASDLTMLLDTISIQSKL